MGQYPAKEGNPTATKDSGAEWYYPAVTTAFGRPKRIPGGDRYETRGKAKAAAKRMIKSDDVAAYKEPQRCAECDCKCGGDECNWIAQRARD